MRYSRRAPSLISADVVGLELLAVRQHDPPPCVPESRWELKPAAWPTAGLRRNYKRGMGLMGDLEARLTPKYGYVTHQTTHEDPDAYAIIRKPNRPHSATC